MSQLTFSILQTDIVWQNPAQNRALITEQLKYLPATTQVVVLPEMFTTGFSMDTSLAETMTGETVTWLLQSAKQFRKIIAGSILIQENNQFYNRFLWVLPNGTIHHYDKRHLFSLANEQEHFTPGSSRTVVQVNGIKICLQICYDLRFPVFMRQQSGNEYDIILMVANWPVKRLYAWQQLLIARAIENQCAVIAVNRVGTDGNDWHFPGSSMVINAMGEVKQQLNNQPQIHTFLFDLLEIQNVRTTLPFLKDSDDFILL